MEKKQNYDNDGLDPSEEYYRKKKKGNKKVMMRIPISLQKNQNLHITRNINNIRSLNSKRREFNYLRFL